MATLHKFQIYFITPQILHISEKKYLAFHSTPAPTDSSLVVSTACPGLLIEICFPQKQTCIEILITTWHAKLPLKLAMLGSSVWFHIIWNASWSRNFNKRRIQAHQKLQKLNHFCRPIWSNFNSRHEFRYPFYVALHSCRRSSTCFSFNQVFSYGVV